MLNTRPVYRIGAAGLDLRDWRLIEIVFKYSQYNRFEFQLKPQDDPALIDILIANTNDPAGMQAVSAVRTSNRPIPIIAAVPRGALGAGKHAISIDRLTLQLLPILNRVVELELDRNPLAPPKASAAAPVPWAVPARALPDPVAVVVPRDDRDGRPAVPLPRPFPPSGARLVADITEAAAPVTSVAATTPAVVPAMSAPAPAQGPVTFAAAPTPPTVQPEITLSSKIVQPAPLPPQAKLITAAPLSDAAQSLPTGQPSLPVFPIGAVLPPPAPQQLRVLVVDDSPTVRQQLSGALLRMGLACDAVGSADDAIDRLADQHYDLALLDVVMPNVDGYKLTRHLKRDKQHRQMPVILLTSKSSPFDLVRGALAGCDTYLVKPVPLKALEAALFKQLRKSLAIDDLSAMLRPELPAVQIVPAVPAHAAMISPPLPPPPSVGASTVDAKAPLPPPARPLQTMVAPAPVSAPLPAGWSAPVRVPTVDSPH